MLFQLEKPKTLQSIPSPDGRLRAVVLRYECLSLPGSGVDQLQNAYELLKLVRVSDGTETILESQVLYCGGLGAFGLKALSWTRNNRYLYYTDTREGMPDGGCYAWRRSLIAYELANGARTGLSQEPLSPNGRTLASQSGGELLLWDQVNGGVLSKVPLAEPTWTVTAIAWAPGSRSLVYQQKEPDACGPTGRSLLVRLDLPDLQQTTLLSNPTQIYAGVQWTQANQIQLTSWQGKRWRLELNPRRLLSLSPPDVFYFTGSTLFQQPADKDPFQVYTFSDLGAILDSLRVGDQVFVLGKQSLQRYDLLLQAHDVLRRFDQPLIEGRLSSDHPREQVVLSAVYRDPQCEFTLCTLLGFYNLRQKTVRELPLFHHRLRFLGFDADDRSLDVLAVGEDPEFGGILVLDPQTGQEIKQIALYGSLFAALSPDRKTLATRWYTSPPGDPPRLIPEIYLYDLSHPAPPRTFLLPRSGSDFIALSWSAGGDRLYFHLVTSANFDYNTRTYGIWALDVASGRISQVAPLAEANAAWINLDPQWILLQSYTFDRPLLLIDLATGQQRSLSIPPDAQIVH